MPEAQRAPQVLIAEHSLTEARHLQSILEHQGYRVTAASNGRAALECARRERPALIISAAVMPEMTGYELCRAIKQDADLKDVPMMLVTTLSDPHDVIRAIECGADQFILKPYETSQLLRRIQLALANDRLHRDSVPPPGLEIVFRGQLYCITADRSQILTLLLSTYEAAIERNDALQRLKQTTGEPVRPPAAEPVAARTAPLKSLRILVVDDDPMLSQSLRNTLQAEGHLVRVTNSGRAGIEAFQAAHQGAEPFDAVITDLGMPHVDGRQVARAIRALAAQVPIIMLTGWGRNQLADTTPPPEVDRLLNKPPRLSELRAVLAELTAATCAADPDPPRESSHHGPR
jgi:DNA-binding response OmpR family regulator